jgi:DNA-3-methyladenine glycosylase I
MKSTATSAAEPVRCPWAGSDPLYLRYHDEEWGTPTHDDRRHFEFLVLESAQAGLAWITILRKRENYRKAYRGFDPKLVARFGACDVERLLTDPGIVRNRAKIEASIGNARQFLEIQAEFGSFDRWLYSQLGGRPIINQWKRMKDIPPRTELSDAIAKELKQRGFRFLGPTIVYSHLQAVGAVNDHLVDCFRWKAVARGRPRGAARAQGRRRVTSSTATRRHVRTPPPREGGR